MQAAARKRASQDAEFVETLRLAARDVAAAQHDAQQFATTDADDANRTAADAAARWVVAAHRTTAHPLLADDDGEENLLDLAISALGDEDPLLPKVLAALGAERSAELAVRDSGGDCPLVKCCLAPWKPRTLGALLRAAAGSGFGGEACHDAPRKEVMLGEASFSIGWERFVVLFTPRNSRRRRAIPIHTAQFLLFTGSSPPRSSSTRRR